MKHHDVKLCECGAQAWTPVKWGGVLTVDADKQELLAGYWWTIIRAGKTLYAESPTAQKDGHARLLHRNIVQGALIDHRDRNGLSNMRENLRSTDRRGNLANIRPRKGKKYRGVKLDPRTNLKKRWIARIARTHLGRFATAEEAAMAFDAAAVVFFGAEARLNLP